MIRTVILAKCLFKATSNSYGVAINRASSMSAFQYFNKFAAVAAPRYNFTSSGDTTVNHILEEVESKVFQVLRSASKCKIEKLARGSTFEELGFDSLDGVELVVAMEELFGFDITNEEAEKITSVQEAIAIFNKNLVEKINRDKLVDKSQTDSTPAEKK